MDFDEEHTHDVGEKYNQVDEDWRDSWEDKIADLDDDKEMDGNFSKILNIFIGTSHMWIVLLFPLLLKIDIERHYNFD